MIIISSLALFFLLRGSGSASLGSGVFAPEDPIQASIDHPIPFQKDGFEITPLAEYTIEAKILSAKRYRGRSGANKLSPIDYALGWGRMSDEQVTSQIDINQHGRFYFWRTSPTPPIPIKEIKTSSANTHLIPATTNVRESLLRAKVGSIIYLHGKLVKVEADNAWKWQSSLTRNDTGNGACEILYVENAYVTKSK